MRGRPRLCGGPAIATATAHSQPEATGARAQMTSTTPTPTMSTSSSSPASASSHDDAVANWWEYGSVPLVKRCIREYGWSDKYSAQVLEGYKKFLQLKKDLSDWDHKILSPSIPVDKMWHMHILDVTNYIKDCELLCGHLVGHDPDGMLNADARKRRVETTRHILQNQLGGEMDEEVWNFGVSDDNSQDRKRRRKDEHVEHSSVSGSQLQPQVTTLKCTAGKLAIIVKDANGEEVEFEMNHKTKMGKVFKAYAEHKGLSPSAFRFLLQGERIVDDSTPRTLELEDGDLIDAVLEHAAC